MTNKATTPGPWYVDHDSEGGYCDIRNRRDGKPTEWGIATVWYQSGGAVDSSENEGNALLLAAAPELRDMLKASLRFRRRALEKDHESAHWESVLALLTKVGGAP